MKVLFVTNLPSPYRVAFFNELGLQCDLTVAFEGRSATDRDKAWVGEDAAHYTARFMRGRRVSAEQFFCPEIISVLKEGFDRVILGGYSSPTSMLAIAYLRMRRISYFIEVDGGLIRQDSKAKYLLKKALLGSANYWFSSGAHTTDCLCHYGARREDVFRYPFSSLREADILSVAATPEEKVYLRQELGMDPQKKVILAVGQFIPRKGFDVLLNAAAKLPAETELYFVGGKPTEEYLEQCRSLGLTNVYFHGFQSKESLARYYKAADLFVLPTREDIWGLVINEAMAYGLPVITTDRCVAGLELVENGVNGYIVPVDDADALANAVCRCLSADLSAMGAASLEKIRPYTIENMAKVHMDVLNR